MKYRCIEAFEVDCYTDGGMLTEGRVKIACGGIWEHDNETDIIGAGVHLDNVETSEWLEIPGKDLEEYFEPLNENLKEKREYGITKNCRYYGADL